METRWPEKTASLRFDTFLPTCTQFLWHCKIEVVQLVEGGEVAPDMLFMGLSLVVHLGWHRGSHLNVS